MKSEKISEGRAKILVPKGIPTKKLSVFYNPEMKLNRDIAVLLLNSINKKSLMIADPLAATGVRAARFMKELGKNKIESVSINDSSKEAVKLARKNMSLNRLQKSRKLSFHCMDASLFLLESMGFDYIDIDPFGSPNPFLDAAAKRLSRDGILAVTATDTAALAGTSPSACLRKYWAVPIKNEMMHENGIRILIRKIQLVAAQYDKALTPIFSHSTRHYMRVYFACKKSKAAVDKLLKKHGMLNSAGPMWLGQLWDKKLARTMLAKSDKKNSELANLLRIIRNESEIDAAGFYDVDKICSTLRRAVPKRELLFRKIKGLGYRASKTHFSPSGIRSNIGLNRLKKAILSLS